MEIDPQVVLGNQIRDLVKERVEMIVYLKSIFTGKGMYFGTVRITLGR